MAPAHGEIWFGPSARAMVARGWGAAIPVDGKRPVHKQWQRWCATDMASEDVERLAQRYYKLGAGLPIGRGILAIDIDVRTPRVDVIVALAREVLGDTPFVREGKPPKVALLYRLAGALSQPVLTLAAGDQDDLPSKDRDKVECFTGNKQLVCYGIHPDTRKPYRWTGDAEPITHGPEVAPIVTAAQVHAFLTRVKPLLGIAARPAAAPPHLSPATPAPDVVVLDDGTAARRAALRDTGARHEALVTVAAQLAAAGWTADAMRAELRDHWLAVHTFEPSRDAAGELEAAIASALRKYAPAAKLAAVAGAGGLSQSSPDGRVVVTATRQGAKVRPYVRVTVDGTIAVAEECALTSRNARVALADQVAPEHRGWLGGALVLLADAWAATLAQGKAAPAPTESAVVVAEVVPWPEPVELDDILDQTRRRVLEHLYLPPHAAVALTLWIAGTHAFVVTDGALACPFPHYPLAWFNSATRACGKSRAVALVAALARRAFNSENCSTAAAFRVASSHYPAALFDEVDTWLSEDKGREFIGFLNASVTRGGTFTRVVGDAHEVRSFPVFGPRVIAGIGTRLADPTRSRAVRIRLERKPTGHRVADLYQHGRWSEPLRAQLARAVEDAVPALEALFAEDGPTRPEGLEDRTADMWAPLLALAEVAGGEWPELARAACRILTREAAAQDEEEGDIGVRLLAAVREVFAEKRTDALAAEDLRAALIADPASTWAEYRTGAGGRSDPISARGVAQLLRRFGITAHKDRTARWYRLADFAPAFARYFPDAEHPSQASHAPPIVTLTPHVTHVTLPESPEDEGLWTAILAGGPPPDDDDALMAAD